MNLDELLCTLESPSVIRQGAKWHTLAMNSLQRSNRNALPLQIETT